jgi:hypothetical protein
MQEIAGHFLGTHQCRSRFVDGNFRLNGNGVTIVFGSRNLRRTPSIHPHVFLASVSELEHKEMVASTSDSVSSGVGNGRDNGKKGEDFDFYGPAAIVKDCAWHGSVK